MRGISWPSAWRGAMPASVRRIPNTMLSCKATVVPPVRRSAPPRRRRQPLPNPAMTQRPTVPSGRASGTAIRTTYTGPTCGPNAAPVVRQSAAPRRPRWRHRQTAPTCLAGPVHRGPRVPTTRRPSCAPTADTAPDGGIATVRSMIGPPTASSPLTRPAASVAAAFVRRPPPPPASTMQASSTSRAMRAMNGPGSGPAPKRPSRTATPQLEAPRSRRAAR